LRGKGVYIFQIGTGLTINVGAQVILEGGAQAADVFWQVGSAATLDSGVKFEGTILAGTSVTMGKNTVLVGRALASTGNVTLISDRVTLPPAIN
jgi:type VI secretion system secreted protein VgrG